MQEPSQPFNKTFNPSVFCAGILFIFIYTLIATWLDARMNKDPYKGLLSIRSAYGSLSCQLPASQYFDYKSGMKNNGEAVEKGHANPNEALFNPNDRKMNEYVSLGFQGELVLEINDEENNIDVKQLDISESSPSNQGCEKNPEKAEVYISGNNENWIYLGSGCGSFTLDVSGATSIQSDKVFVKIIDSSNPDEFPEGEDGFDLHGILAHGVCTPVEEIPLDVYTPSPEPSDTLTLTVPNFTDTPSPVPSDTLTRTVPTFTNTPSLVPTSTLTLTTSTATYTPSSIATGSFTPTRTFTPTKALTYTLTPTFTKTLTVTASITFTPSPSRTHTLTPTSTLKRTKTPGKTITAATNTVQPPKNLREVSSKTEPPFASSTSSPDPTQPTITSGPNGSQKSLAVPQPAEPTQPDQTDTVTPTSSPTVTPTLSPKPAPFIVVIAEGLLDFFKEFVQDSIGSILLIITIPLLLSNYLKNVPANEFKKMVSNENADILKGFLFNSLTSDFLYRLWSNELSKIESKIETIEGEIEVEEKRRNEKFNENRESTSKLVNERCTATSNKAPITQNLDQQKKLDQLKNIKRSLVDDREELKEHIQIINDRNHSKPTTEDQRSDRAPRKPRGKRRRE